jgi:hypothetical protein
MRGLSRIRRRVLAGGCVLALSIALLIAPAVGADRRTGEAQLLFWGLGFKLTQDHEGNRTRLDVNSATVQELRAVPGIELRQARRIIAERPYANLQDLARADLSRSAIARLTKFVVVASDWPGALPK